MDARQPAPAPGDGAHAPIQPDCCADGGNQERAPTGPKRNSAAISALHRTRRAGVGSAIARPASEGRPVPIARGFHQSGKHSRNSGVVAHQRQKFLLIQKIVVDIRPLGRGAGLREGVGHSAFDRRAAIVRIGWRAAAIVLQHTLQSRDVSTFRLLDIGEWLDFAKPPHHGPIERPRMIFVVRRRKHRRLCIRRERQVRVERRIQRALRVVMAMPMAFSLSTSPAMPIAASAAALMCLLVINHILGSPAIKKGERRTDPQAPPWTRYAYEVIFQLYIIGQMTACA